MKKELLRIENLKKNNVLKWIQLQVYESEIIHLIFDNIQEKHLFLDILTGRIRADFGRLYYEEQEVPEYEVPSLMDKQVAVISNQSNLIDSVTILENLFLIRREVKEQWARSREYKQTAVKVFKEFAVDVDITMAVEKLSTFEKVQLEMIRAYLLKKKIVLLTALGNTLSDREERCLWSLVGKMRESGISCILAEPLESMNFFYTDRLVIIKHGKTCAVKTIEECDYTMLHTILNQNGSVRSEEREVMILSAEAEDKVIVEGIVTDYLKDVSIQIGMGEVVKLFCVDERSYEQITGVFRGILPVSSGRVRKNHKTYEIKKTFRGIKDGIGLLDGNQVTRSLFMELTAMDNLQMLLSQRVNGMWIRPKYKKSIRLSLAGYLTEDIYQKRMRELTEPEIQKIAYCRWLLYSPELLVCIQPFAGSDIQARETAREMVGVLESRGIPILIITSNTLEFNYCRGKEVFLRKGKIISKEEAHQKLRLIK